MTCGICNPTVTAQLYGADNRATKVIGYAAGPGSTVAVQTLYAQGAYLVMWDEHLPFGQHVTRRDKLSRLIELFLRSGDTLLVDSRDSLGATRKTQGRIIHLITDLGVCVIFADEQSNPCQLREVA